MDFRYFIRGIVTLVLIVLILLGLGAIALLLSLAGIPISLPNGLSFAAIVVIALIFLASPWGKTVFGKDILADIDRQLDEQFSTLSDAEMLELATSLDELSDTLGVEITPPMKSKKRKREDIDKAIRNLSDTELLHLKDRLRQGEIDEEKLIAWLDSQRYED